MHGQNILLQPFENLDKFIEMSQVLVFMIFVEVDFYNLDINSAYFVLVTLSSWFSLKIQYFTTVVTDIVYSS